MSQSMLPSANLHLRVAGLEIRGSPLYMHMTLLVGKHVLWYAVSNRVRMP